MAMCKRQEAHCDRSCCSIPCMVSYVNECISDAGVESLGCFWHVMCEFRRVCESKWLPAIDKCDIVMSMALAGVAATGLVVAGRIAALLHRYVGTVGGENRISTAGVKAVLGAMYDAFCHRLAIQSVVRRSTFAEYQRPLDI